MTAQELTELARERAQVPEAQLSHRIMDWANSHLLRWKLPNDKIPTIAIWTQWTEDERLKEWTEKQLVVDCAKFSGNGAEMGYAFTYEQLKSEYLDGRDFELPPKRFAKASKRALSLKRIPGEMSFLPGVFYERELGHELFGEGPSWDSAERHDQTSRTFLVLEHLTGARNLLVRFVYHGSHLNDLLLRRDPMLEELLRRSDVMANHSRSFVVDGAMVTETYLLLDLAETRRCGYLNEELLATAPEMVSGVDADELLDEVISDELVRRI